ncbi:cytochrome b561 domain-containing protein At2g30890 [Manihot esculenta]|uniref:Cytochrome b561 domain-containing protein n=1 Tax=Manihot esculenta TaxID=3983 RepID=A0A2C9WC59_MANES|nr:cytochrome b561 domain-containing protein At2g30890 [Manihot esculenta]OAY57327.1 hypothetical protein MANES_02G088400v8 [Manihot esculenta]
MQALQKPVSFIIYASLLHLVSSSSEQVKITGNDTSSENGIPQISSKLVFEITLHGVLLWASMGFLMPVGILSIRMSNREKCRKRLKILFYLHSISQMLSVLLATAGAVMSVKNFNNAFNNHHQRIGVALYGIVWLQVLIGLLRPQRGSKARSIWFFWHWMLGTAVSLLGIINIYTGLQAYHQKTYKSTRPWTALFIIEVSLIALFYLLQDKWVYMQKQGVILGGEPVRLIHLVATTQDKQKESTNESC